LQKLAELMFLKSFTYRLLKLKS